MCYLHSGLNLAKPWVPAFTHCCIGVPQPAPPRGFQTQVTCSLPAGTPEAPGCCRLTAHALRGTHRLLPVSEKRLAALQEPLLSDCEMLAGADCHYQGISPLMFHSAPLREDNYPFPLGFVRSPKPATCWINTSRCCKSFTGWPAEYFTSDSWL